ncbi:MAG: flagellar basal body P-ring protein FlgI [Acidobacteriota bacterium]
MRTTVIATVFAVLVGAAGHPAAESSIRPGATRVKDISSLQGAYSVPLIGYGLVVGLNKTGDKKQTIFPAQTLANMLERFGVSVPGGQFKIENVAAVIVTTELPQYARTGTRLDITASSIGDARSLQGGVLLPTPMRGPDGQVRATAQGSLSLGGFGGGSGSNNVQVNHLTVGRVPSGGLVETNTAAPAAAVDSISFALKDPDFVSASRLTQAINAELGPDSAHAVDSATVVVRVPAEYRESVPALIARLEPLSVDVDAVARVVINERTGTVVVGGAVRLGPAAVAHGNLSVKITTRLEASQPAPLSQGATVLVPNETVDVQEGRAKLVMLEQGTTLEAVVRALNALGASPRDIIAIMQGLKAAGALQAELVIL